MEEEVGWWSKAWITVGFTVCSVALLILFLDLDMAKNYFSLIVIM